jgi:hypothetical protein
MPLYRAFRKPLWRFLAIFVLAGRISAALALSVVGVAEAQTIFPQTLPDQRTPEVQTATHVEQTRADATRISVSPSVSAADGLSLETTYAARISPRRAVGLLSSVGPRRAEFTVNTGWMVRPNARIVASLSSLAEQRQLLLPFSNQRTDYGARQIAAVFGYDQRPHSTRVGELGLRMYRVAKTSGRVAGPVETAKTARLEVPGAVLSGFAARGRFRVLPWSSLRLAGGAEQLHFNAKAGRPASFALTSSIEWSQRLRSGFHLDFREAAVATQLARSVQLSRTLGGERRQWTIAFERVKERGAASADKRLTWSYAVAIGAASIPGPSRQDPGLSAHPFDDLLESVSVRPFVLPVHLIANADRVVVSAPEPGASPTLDSETATVVDSSSASGTANSKSDTSVDAAGKAGNSSNGNAGNGNTTGGSSGNGSDDDGNGSGSSGASGGAPATEDPGTSGTSDGTAPGTSGGDGSGSSSGGGSTSNDGGENDNGGTNDSGGGPATGDPGTGGTSNGTTPGTSGGDGSGSSSGGGSTSNDGGGNNDGGTSNSGGGNGSGPDNSGGNGNGNGGANNSGGNGNGNGGTNNSGGNGNGNGNGGANNGGGNGNSSGGANNGGGNGNSNGGGKQG